MLAKYSIIIFLFLVVSIIQASFLPFFAFMGIVPNLIFALFFILIFFENKRTHNTIESFSIYHELASPHGFFLAIIGGFFLDIFSLRYVGTSIFLALVIFFLAAAVMHFLRESREPRMIWSFIALFTACFMVYEVVLRSFAGLSIDSGIIVSLIYTMIFACIGFY